MSKEMTLSKRIDILKFDIERKQKELDNFEVEVSDEQYDEFLDECYEEFKIGYLTFSPSQILSECDPIAYRCGKGDYEDSLEKEDQPEYMEIESEIEEMQTELDDLLEMQNAESEEDII